MFQFSVFRGQGWNDVGHPYGPYIWATWVRAQTHEEARKKAEAKLGTSRPLELRQHDND